MTDGSSIGDVIIAWREKGELPWKTPFEEVNME